jgi:recombination protein RecR
VQERARNALIEALRRLPGVGVKSAQRMAYHLLQHDREGARGWRRRSSSAVANVRHCERCHTFTEHEVCSTAATRRASGACCASSRRRPTRRRSSAAAATRAVLRADGAHQPARRHRRRRHRLRELLERATDGEVQEVIVATNFTAEGEATAHALARR